MGEFESVLMELGKGLRKNSLEENSEMEGSKKRSMERNPAVPIKRRRRTWTKVKLLFKEKEFDEMVQRLERGKNMLGLAVDCYSM